MPYPGSFDSFLSPGAELDVPAHSSMHLEVAEALTDIESTLGLNPQVSGSNDYGTVNDRLAAECVKITTSAEAVSHINGRVRMDTDTGRLSWSNGSVWNVFAGPPLSVNHVLDTVGVNRPSPTVPMHVLKGEGMSEPGAGPNEVGRFVNTGQPGDWSVVTIIADREGESHLRFGDQDSNNTGGFAYSHDGDELRALTGLTVRQRWSATESKLESVPLLIDRGGSGPAVDFGLFDALQVKNNANTTDQAWLNLGAGVQGVSGVRFSDASGNAGSVRYEHGTDSLVLFTGSTEAMRVFADGLTRIQRGGGPEPSFLPNEALRVRKNTVTGDNCVITNIAGAGGIARYTYGHGGAADQCVSQWDNATNTYRLNVDAGQTGLEIARNGLTRIGTGAFKFEVQNNGAIAAVGIDSDVNGTTEIGTGARKLIVQNSGALFHQDAYDSTTAVAANVAVLSTGRILRSTSLLAHKEVQGALSVPEATAIVQAAQAHAFKSKSPADDPEQVFVGAIADWVAGADPRAGAYGEDGSLNNYDTRSVLSALCTVVADLLAA